MTIERVYDELRSIGEIYTELDDNLERKRQPGGYIWRAKMEDAEQITLDLLVDEPDAGKRAKLRKLHDLLRELQRYRGGSEG